MESKGQIEPHRITKPIQLLAAWLLGLVFVDGSFLIAAFQITQPKWASGALVVASICNVPLFLLSIFLLQTKFRPEMQEDSFYSKYLESKTGDTKREITAEYIATLREDVASLERVVAENVLHSLSEAEKKKIRWSSVTVRLNKTLKNFSSIADALAENGIPVHETFGGGAGAPGTFSVAIGSGFDREQMKALVDAILSITDGWMCYAFEDDSNYDNEVLIGAYGSYDYGIELSKAKKMLEQENITEREMYKAFGLTV